MKLFSIDFSCSPFSVVTLPAATATLFIQVMLFLMISEMLGEESNRQTRSVFGCI